MLGEAPVSEGQVGPRETERADDGPAIAHKKDECNSRKNECREERKQGGLVYKKRVVGEENTHPCEGL